MILADPGRPPRQQVGAEGEDEAARVLRSAGLRILERRWRRPYGEIDLIAEEGDLLVFVEVKSRTGSGYGAPAEAVTAGKRRRIARVALAYLQHRRWTDRRCRFDVVEVEARRGRTPVARHLPDAFRLWPTG